MALMEKAFWMLFFSFMFILFMLFGARPLLDFMVDLGARTAERQQSARDMRASVAPVDAGVRDLARSMPDLAPPPKMWFERGPKAEGSGKRAALTFDDGPCGQTSVMLDMLCATNAKATFFLTGANVKRCPEEVKRIRSEGHEIGLHGFEHVNFRQSGSVKFKLTKPRVDGGVSDSESKLRADEEIMVAQVTRNQDVLDPLIGYRPTIFRPPFGGGALSDSQKKWLVAHGIITVLWSIDSGDSSLVYENPHDRGSPRRQLNADEIESTVVSQIHDGAIVLLHSFGGHEGRGATVTAASSLIPRLRKQGYTFVTVSQLIGAGAPLPMTVQATCHRPTGESAPDAGVASDSGSHAQGRNPLQAIPEIDTSGLDEVLGRDGGTP